MKVFLFLVLLFLTILAVNHTTTTFAESEEIFRLQVSTQPNILFLNGAGTYAKGEEITIEKAPEKWQEYTFVGWKIDGVWTDDNPVTIRMDKNHKAVAVYTKNGHVELIIDSIPRKAEIIIDDKIYLPSELPKTLSVPADSEYTISLKDVVTEDPNTRYVFDKWKDLNYESTRTITVTEDTELIALYETQYFLKPMSKHGTVEGNDWWAAGSKANFQVTPEIVDDKNNDRVRYIFDRWDGGDHPSSTSNVIDMEASAIVSAFWDTQYKLDLFSNIPNIKPYGTGWYDTGKTITLIADEELESPFHDTQYVFEKWNSVGTNSASITNPHSTITTVTMDQPYVIEAKYRKSHLVNVWSPYGLSSGGGFYDEGATAEISISALQIDVEPNRVRKVFSGWNSDNSRMIQFDGMDGIGNQNLVVFVDRPMNVTANWKTQYFLDVESAKSETMGSGWYDVGKHAQFSVKRPSISPEFWTSHLFAGWSGDYDGTSTKGKILMNSPKIITAEWKEDNTPGFVNSILLASVAIGGMVIYNKTKYKKDSKSQTVWSQAKIGNFTNKKQNNSSYTTPNYGTKIKDILSKIFQRH